MSCHVLVCCRWRLWRRQLDYVLPFIRSFLNFTTFHLPWFFYACLFNQPLSSIKLYDKERTPAPFLSFCICYRQLSSHVPFFFYIRRPKLTPSQSQSTAKKKTWTNECDIRIPIITYRPSLLLLLFQSSLATTYVDHCVHTVDYHLPLTYLTWFLVINTCLITVIRLLHLIHCWMHSFLLMFVSSLSRFSCFLSLDKSLTVRSHSSKCQSLFSFTTFCFSLPSFFSIGRPRILLSSRICNGSNASPWKFVKATSAFFLLTSPIGLAPAQRQRYNNDLNEQEEASI